MKKTLALILAVLVALSMFSFATFAADTVTITFMNEGAEYAVAEVTVNEEIAPHVPADPTKAPTENKEFLFKGWKSEANGEIYYKNTFPLATEDATFIAVYSEKEIKETQTFWNFIESIFARINLIFEYFAEIFNINND